MYEEKKPIPNQKSSRNIGILYVELELHTYI